MIIEETLRIALEAHEGQKDLDGRPAVLHPVAVGLMGCNDAETKTGFLHDVVEDSDLTLDELRGRGVDEDVLAALQLLTHAKTEDYFDYLRPATPRPFTSRLTTSGTILKEACGPMRRLWRTVTRRRRSVWPASTTSTARPCRYSCRYSRTADCYDLYAVALKNRGDRAECLSGSDMNSEISGVP